MSQSWIQTGERSGLQTHIAATEKRFVVHAEEKLTAFLELERRFELATNCLDRFLPDIREIRRFPW